MAYFNNFPKVFYRFGNNEEPVTFPILNTYVDLITDIADDIQLYEKYTIQPGERADTLSHKLYGSTEYYWTFFMINDKLRESGWPTDGQSLYDLAKTYYPHRTFVTETNISNSNFKIGETVTGSQSGTTGVIVEVNHNLGQVVVNTTNNFNAGESVTTGTGGDVESCVVLKESAQFESVHHYESNGEHIDIDPYNQVTSGFTPVTYLDRLVATNDDLSEINVLTDKALRQVVAEFNRLVKN